MKVDSPLVAAALGDVPAIARQVEADGYDGLSTFEGPRDPFLPLMLAAEHTERVELMTAIAIAFARNPMTVANLGWDLHAASGGRAIVGLGSQIKPHIEKRFSMVWSDPAARMREFIGALRAIFATWQDGTPLRFEGTYYRHTLMTPFFTPEPLPTGPPRIFLAGVGPAMTRVAGDLADGFFVHPFNTPDHLRAETLVALHAGAAAGRPDFEIAWPVMIATGATDEARAGAEYATRAQIAFYASTPAYRGVLDHHDRGELQPEFNRLSKLGDWDAMVTLVDDELFDLIAIRGTPAQCGRELARRTIGLVDRVATNAPYASSPAVWREVLKTFRESVDQTGRRSSEES
ncbi:MAG: TIGR03617 family F420-dependent LLM class oxidoreductase [Acidimicrobiia bacterium]|nr:TIGR03617 family F420-dependent LLM class oxidoreductase [Acidimicrobiia bacterium]